ncbi:hypothetical protein FACS1894184_16500 [Clostridia bacterium]|nr:hypothetical protein FACS1894184_16500 [Clostridia bacterium]
MSTYNRDGAVNYAMQWALGHNGRYIDYDNDDRSNTTDCANFVSQCLFEGGGLPMKYNTTSGPYDSWYYNTPGGALTSKSGSWAGAQSLRLFLKYNTVGYPRIAATFLDNSTGMQKGDLLFVIDAGNSSKNLREANHVGIVSRVNGGTLYYCAHSAARKDQQWTVATNNTLYCKLSDTILVSGSGTITPPTGTSWQSCYGIPVLQQSSTYNAYAKNLQQDLIICGFSCGNAGDDGYFGAATTSAVKLFQGSKGLVVDGKAGDATKIALFNENYGS